MSSLRVCGSFWRDGLARQHNEDSRDKVARVLASKLAAATSAQVSAEIRAIQTVDYKVRKIAEKASESNYTLWSTLAREQAMRREQHDRLLLQDGPVRVHCRIRPLTSSERAKGMTPSCRLVGGNMVEVRQVTFVKDFTAVKTPSKTQVWTRVRPRPLLVAGCIAAASQIARRVDDSSRLAFTWADPAVPVRSSIPTRVHATEPVPGRAAVCAIGSGWAQV